MPKVRPLKVKILDASWSVYLLPEADYVAQHGADSEAITLTDKRQIHFNVIEYADEAIGHEIFHAYFNSLLTMDCFLTQDQTEELCANLVGRYYDAIHKNVTRIENYLNRHKKALLKIE